AGTGKEGHEGDGGPSTSATFDTIRGLAVDQSGNVFISEGSISDWRIRKLTRDTPLAGGGSTGGSTGGTSSTAYPTEPKARTDFSGDGTIDFSDFITFASAFGQKSTDSGFNPRIDLNDDGSVNFPDFIIFK
ncbi:MAG: hypothetical protein ACO36I_21260, partial [Candidatus Latescibacterota bacterium]